MLNLTQHVSFIPIKSLANFTMNTFNMVNQTHPGNPQSMSKIIEIFDLAQLSTALYMRWADAIVLKDGAIRKHLKN